jgi:FMN phosphatase YigB (HAD superfamily)
LKAASESSIIDSSSGSSATGATLESEPDASHIAFGQSVKDWSLFPDTYEALKRLSKYYKLCVLSNTDNQSFGKTLATLSEGRIYSELPVDIRETYKYPSPNPDKFWFPREAKGSNSPFTLIITAEVAGSYKPDPNGFEKILETIRTDSRLLGGDASVEEAKSKLLWVAQSLYHDHETAQAMGIHSVWINRQSASMGMHASSEKKYNWTFHTLGEMADAVEAEFGQSG